MNQYPKGGWNVRIKVNIEDFVDTWMIAVNKNLNYGAIAKILGCEIVDVQYAEVRIRKQGVNLPKLNLTDENDDSVVVIV